MRLTSIQLQEILARQNASALARQRASNPDMRLGPPADKEDELQQAVEDYCLSKGYYFSRSRMDRKTTTKKGTLDFTIVTPRRTIFLELKALNRKPSPAQNQTIAWIDKQHNPNVITGVANNIDGAIWIIEHFENRPPLGKVIEAETKTPM